MAADNYATISGPWATRRTAALPVANTARQVICPDWARRVTVSFVAADGTTLEIGKIAETGTDGVAIGNNTYPVSVGGLTWRLSPGRVRAGAPPSIYVTGSTNAGFAHILFEGE